ncbi:MAG: MAPEG family protein [Sphingomonadales bacterium]|nr:MAG: MAPEG family protein [Sphingomonadales bacterium]
MHTPILRAVIVLVLWTFVMWAWLYATRIPAMNRLKLDYDPRRPGSEFVDRFPPEVRWKADNYNHLHEQPTIFYAVAITLAILGAGGGLNALLAWVYVGLRVAHSLVQATVNAAMPRFGIFMVASLVLLWLTINAALIVFSGPAA